MGFFSGWFGKPTREAFAARMLTAIRNCDRAGTYEFNQEDFSIVCTSRSRHINLGNFYIEYNKLSAGHRKQFVREIARMLTASNDDDAPQSYEDVRSRLRPKVWSAMTIESLRLQSQIDGNEKPSLQMPHYELGTHLIGTVVVDMPQTMRSIRQQDLDDWGVSFYEALEIARANLAEIPTNYAQIGDELYVVMPQDAYETSRLFNLEWVRKLSIQGDPVALAPTRDHLLITGSENAALWEVWLTLAEKSFREDARPLTMSPLRLDDDTWVDWLPPEDHSIYGRLRRSIDLDLANCYTEQLNLLRKVQQSRGTIAAELAPVMAWNDEQGKLATTFSIWANGVSTWLPQTSEVSFVDGERQWSNRIPWSVVQDVVGYKLNKLDSMYPPRWETDGFPSSDELQAMDAAIQEE